MLLTNLLATTSSPALAPSHCTAACDALQRFLSRCMGYPSLRRLIASANVWFALLNIYLDRAGNFKAKTMRQVLFTLSDLILKGEDPGVTMTDVAGRLVGIIFHQ